MAVAEMREGMVIVQDVQNDAGQKLVSSGTEVTASLLARLLNHAALGKVQEPLLARAAALEAAA